MMPPTIILLWRQHSLRLVSFSFVMISRKQWGTPTHYGDILLA